MSFKITLVIAGILLCFGGLSVNAQPTPTASHLQAAETFLLATGIDKQFDDMTDMMLTTFTIQMPDSKTNLEGAMKKFMGKYFNWEATKSQLSAAYASEFSEADLKELTFFYNTPVGKKYSQKFLQLTQKVLMLGQKIAQDHQTELLQTMMEALKKP
jgi:uncharacterized protein